MTCDQTEESVVASIPTIHVMPANQWLIQCQPQNLKCSLFYFDEPALARPEMMSHQLLEWVRLIVDTRA